MKDFLFYNPVKIVFGKGKVSKIKDLIPSDVKSILLIYGGGSIKRNGVYEDVIQSLNEIKGKTNVVEFGGIEANPEYDTLMKACKIGIDNKCDFVLAVGGGSVIDGAKFVCYAIKFVPKEGENQDPWFMCSGKTKCGPSREHLPMGCVLTLPATGSEMNKGAVISRKSLGLKKGGAYYDYPVFSIMDPTYTFSLPPHQLANGIIDSFVHVAEQYLTYDVGTPLQDRQAEAIMKVLIEESPLIMSDDHREDYETRANFMWCATNALNDVLGCGTVSDWSTHIIGHELTSIYGLDHGQTLAVILPGVLSFKKKEKMKKLLQYAERIFGFTGRDEGLVADQAIQATVNFFESLGVSTRLSGYNIDSQEAAAKISEKLHGRQIGENKGTPI